MSSRVFLAAVAIAAAGCAAGTAETAASPSHPARATRAASSRRDRAPPPSLVSGLEFEVDPSAAEIFIDGQLRGTVRDLAASGGVLTLAPGIYQVSLQAPGRATWRAEVAVGAARERIEVKLLPKN